MKKEWKICETKFYTVLADCLLFCWIIQNSYGSVVTEKQKQKKKTMFLAWLWNNGLAVSATTILCKEKKKAV